jgi:adenylyltransferase/sulfurtransferase
MLYDGLGGAFRTVKVKPDPACALCGPQATITTLAIHQKEAAPVCASPP